MILRKLSLNYLLKLFLLLSEVFILPYYIKALGIEQFGIYGIFLTLAIWFTVMDLGMSQTIQREISNDNAASKDIADLIYSIEKIMIIIFSITTILSLFILNYILNKREHNLLLNTNENNLVILFITLMLVLKIYENIYKNIFIGSDNQIQLNVLLVKIQTIKIISFILIINYSELNIIHFFIFQLIALTLNTFLIRRKIFKINNIKRGKFSILLISKYYKYSLGFTLITLLSLTTNHIDRIVIINYVTLSEYGVYITTLSICSIVHMIALPITQTFGPKLSKAFYSSSLDDFYLNYHAGAYLISILCGMFTMSLILFMDEILHIWISQNEIEDQIKKFIYIILVGNLIGVLTFMPFQALLAKGILKFSIYINIFISIVMIPSTILISKNFEIIGVSYLWLIYNLINFIICIFITARYVIKNQIISWIKNDIALPLILIISITFFYRLIEINFYILVIAYFSTCFLCLKLLSNKVVKIKL